MGLFLSFPSFSLLPTNTIGGAACPRSPLLRQKPPMGEWPNAPNAHQMQPGLARGWGWAESERDEERAPRGNEVALPARRNASSTPLERGIARNSSTRAERPGVGVEGVTSNKRKGQLTNPSLVPALKGFFFSGLYCTFGIRRIPSFRAPSWPSGAAS